MPPEGRGRTLERPGGFRFWVAVVVLAILSAAGVAALVDLIASGPEPRAKWGYTAATLAFLLSAAHGAPVLAFATRVTRGLWGVPLRRAAELFAVAGLVTVPLFVVLLGQMPDLADRPSIWFGWPGAPHRWDSLAIILFGLLGLALLFVSSRPDLATRDRRSRGRAGGLALGWRGAVDQWRVLSGGVVMLGALYFALFVFVHLLLTADLALSLVPGWGSSVLPPYHAVSGLQAGVAATVLALAALRRFGGLADQIGVDPFWNAAKLLLAFAPLVFYFLWSELLTFWYGRTPEERWLLALLMFGPTLLPFALSLALNVVLPLLLLIWHPIRASVAGSTFVAGLVLAGNLIDRVRLFVAAWSAADLPVHHLETHPAGGPPGQLTADLAVVAPLPTIAPPSPADALIVLGLPAAVILLYLLALRLLPAVSIWEHRADRLLRTERPYLKTAVAIIARPR